MTDHDQRACPRCGEPAGEYHFCPSCLAPIDSLAGTATATLSAAANGDTDLMASETSAAAVQVEPEADDTTASPPPAAGLPIHLRGRGGDDASKAPPRVARLEDVLTVADPTPVHHTTNSVPPPGVELPIRLSGAVGDLDQASRQVARLEDVLTVADVKGDPTAAEASAPAVEVDPEASASDDTPTGASIAPVDEVKRPPSVEAPPGARTYVAAHRLRSAFLFEQVSAFESRVDDEDNGNETVVEPPAASVPELGVEATPAPSTPCDCQAQHDAVDESSPSETSRSHWVAAICLIALIALVVVLTGRKPRGSTGS